MEIDKKQEFDALQSLNDQSWSEFKEKTQLEWRLSFALWSSLVASISGFLAGKAAGIIITIPVAFLIVFAFLIILVHFSFLFWIQTSLKKTREFLKSIRAKMWYMVSLNMPQLQSRGRLKQPSLWIQIGITCILLMVFISLAVHSNKV